MKVTFSLFLLISSGLTSDKFYAYYTQLPSNLQILKDYQDQLFSRYSDLVIQFGDQGKVIFSRNTSYLPAWQYGHQAWPFQEVIVRQGDGPGFSAWYTSKILLSAAYRTITRYNNRALAIFSWYWIWCVYWPICSRINLLLLSVAWYRSSWSLGLLWSKK